MQAATRAIDDAQKILIIPHANVDPDGLSSALACYALFSGLGKECTVICPDTPPESLNFLPNFDRLKTEIDARQQFVITLDLAGGMEVESLKYTVEDQKVNIIVVPKKGTFSPKRLSTFDAGSGYDLIVVVDSADLSLLGSMYTENIEFFSSTPILNVDHHVSNSRFGQTHLLDTTAASATEVLYFWFSSVPSWKERISADMATLLLTGLITDTRSFQNPNTTPRSLEVAANLLDLGARQQQIIQHVYKTKPLSTLKIWGRALNRIQVDPQSRIVWSSVSREDLQEMGASSKETHGILDELISTVPDADVHALFTEVEDGGFKASLRSSPAIDVNAIAGSLFAGGGHARAAGFRIKQYPNFQLAVIECIQKIKAEVLRSRTGNDVTPLTPPPSEPRASTQDVPHPSATPTASSPPSPGMDIVKAITP